MEAGPSSVTQLRLYDSRRPHSDPSRSPGHANNFSSRALPRRFISFFPLFFFILFSQDRFSGRLRAHKTKSVLLQRVRGTRWRGYGSVVSLAILIARRLSKSSGIVCDALCCTARVFAASPTHNDPRDSLGRNPSLRALFSRTQPRDHGCPSRLYAAGTPRRG